MSNTLQLRVIVDSSLNTVLNLLKADEVLTVTRNGKETKYNTVSSFQKVIGVICLFLIIYRSRITICKNIIKKGSTKGKTRNSKRNGNAGTSLVIQC